VLVDGEFSNRPSARIETDGPRESQLNQYLAIIFFKNVSHAVQNDDFEYNKKHMASRTFQATGHLEKLLRALGQQIRDHRKKLHISSVATAEAAGISRITLYRIEKGEASVTMGAYLGVIEALGLKFQIGDLQSLKPTHKSSVPEGIPKKIQLSRYKQLKSLAWQLKGTKELSPKEALDLYERNWRHVDFKAMHPSEQKLLEALLAAFGRERLLV
jgi:transcriptional regulator with XRE-family HTH domain